MNLNIKRRNRFRILIAYRDKESILQALENVKNIQTINNEQYVNYFNDFKEVDIKNKKEVDNIKEKYEDYIDSVMSYSKFKLEEKIPYFYCTNELLEDDDVIKAALNIHIKINAIPHKKRTKEILEYSLNVNAMNIQYFTDEEFKLINIDDYKYLLYQNPFIYIFLPEELKTNHSIVLQLLRTNGLMWLELNKELQEKFIDYALRMDGDLYCFLQDDKRTFKRLCISMMSNMSIKYLLKSKMAEIEDEYIKAREHMFSQMRKYNRMVNFLKGKIKLNNVKGGVK